MRVFLFQRKIALKNFFITIFYSIWLVFSLAILDVYYADSVKVKSSETFALLVMNEYNLNGKNEQFGPSLSS